MIHKKESRVAPQAIEGPIQAAPIGPSFSRITMLEGPQSLSGWQEKADSIKALGGFCRHGLMPVGWPQRKR